MDLFVRMLSTGPLLTGTRRALAIRESEVKVVYLPDVLHLCHDSRLGVGRQSMDLEGSLNNDKVTVVEIRNRRSSLCGYLRTDKGRSSFMEFSVLP
jgi:hypothetical protein